MTFLLGDWVTRGLLDTSVFIARENSRPLDGSGLPDELAVSIISIGELRAGVLAASDLETRERRLSTLIEALSLDPIPVDDAVSRAWAKLRVTLRDSGRRIGLNDSWIAATALAHDLPVVSQDDDYSEIPGLLVISV